MDLIEAGLVKYTVNTHPYTDSLSLFFLALEPVACC